MTRRPLIRVRGNSCSDGNTCPTVHFDSEADEFVIQGYEITDLHRLAELNLPTGEAAVRLPAHLLPELRGEVPAC